MNFYNGIKERLNRCNIWKSLVWMIVVFICLNFYEIWLDVYYFDGDFSDCCPHLYGDKLKHNISAAVSSSLPQVSFVYLDIEMIQPGKSFLKVWLMIKQGVQKRSIQRRNIVFQLTIIKIRTTVQKITIKIIHWLFLSINKSFQQCSSGASFHSD